MYRTISMIFVLLFIMALQVMSLREAFTSGPEAPKMCGDQSCEEKKPEEAFGSSQGGAQIQLTASRPAYYLSVA